MNNTKKEKDIVKMKWRLWLVKKLLKNHIDKEEIYQFITSIIMLFNNYFL